VRKAADNSTAAAATPTADHIVLGNFTIEASV
jgi:hypothetical protein